MSSEGEEMNTLQIGVELKKLFKISEMLGQISPKLEVLIGKSFSSFKNIN